VKKETVQLLDFNNSTWELMRTHIKEIEEFLSSREKTFIIANLIAMSVKLILSELMLNEKYKLYPAKVYSDEDFVDMVIDSMTTSPPKIDDVEATENHIEISRKVIWGHIKRHTQRLVYILSSMGNLDEEQESITDKDANIFIECLTVVWVECILRDRETRMLENSYEE